MWKICSLVAHTQTSTLICWTHDSHLQYLRGELPRISPDAVHTEPLAVEHTTRGRHTHRLLTAATVAAQDQRLGSGAERVPSHVGFFKESEKYRKKKGAKIVQLDLVE